MACDYCLGLISLHYHDRVLSNNKGNPYPGIDAYVESGELYITSIANVYEPNFQEVSVPIKYCPMCGMEFKEETHE